MENNPELHFMLDLETLSTRPSAHVLELALVAFDPYTGETRKSLSHHERFGLAPQKGAVVSTSTMEWWVETNQLYFNELLVHKNKLTFEEVLKDINHTFSTIRDMDNKVRVWCTGSFDVDVINDAWRRFGGASPLVRYYEVRDVRVTRQIASDFGIESEEDASHNAYEDCIRQINYVHDVYGALNGRISESAGDPRGRVDVPRDEERTNDESAGE